MHGERKLTEVRSVSGPDTLVNRSAVHFPNRNRLGKPCGELGHHFVNCRSKGEREPLVGSGKIDDDRKARSFDPGENYCRKFARLLEFREHCRKLEYGIDLPWY